MTAPYSPDDRLWPLDIPIARTETVRFSFVPSEQLSERLWALTKPRYRDEMGRKGLYLYSESGVKVSRHSDGALSPNEERMTSELRKIIETKPSDTQRRISRSVGGGTVRDIESGNPLGVRIDLRILLDTNTIKAIHKNPHIPDEVLNGGGVNAGLFVPMPHVLGEDEFKQQYQELGRFVHGEDWVPTKPEEDLRNPSLTLGAYVTNMRISLR